MDSYTLVIVSALASIIMAAAMYLLYRASPRAACLLDWSRAGLFFLASNGIALLAQHGAQLPFVIVPGVANVCYIAGHYMIYAGVRRHLGLRPRFDWLLLLMLAVLALHATGFAHVSVSQRLIMLTPFVAGINLGTVWLLARQYDRPAYLPLMIVEAVFMLQLSLRALLLALGRPVTLTLFGNQILQTAGSLAVLAFLSLATMCCALIVIRQQELALRSASLTDSLTGWLNRRALLDMADGAFQRHRRHLGSGETLHFLIFDIDHFKSINDQHGHAVGDAAIRHVTTVAAQALRGYDARFRIGGEEFAVLLGGDARLDPREIAERLRALIETSPLLVDGARISLTASLGVAACAADDRHWDDALRRADQALYHAKRSGRNRLCVHGEDLQPAILARSA
ncbi:GGDEF domain-containing protein [Duganella callida]|uniref:diguanylate cyclase n=1 Tax=Duganella callida TaxID=2561932 RepID=A0A4Y9S4D6_9BURK|nr:GGDEF domain-containing protein [Duganella callida]TFW16298.1 GGDEF domain-containing protein [Duganella callida]